MIKKFDELNEYLIEGFISLGCNKVIAEAVSHSLLVSEFSGVKSHGLSMALQHAKKILNKEYNLTTEFIVEKESPSFMRINCNNTIGMYSALTCMKMAIEKAKNVGMFTVYANHCNTFSAAFIYTLQAAEQGMIGLVISNSPAQMAPWGGKTKLLGTNPMSYAVPGKNKSPIVFDMATSIVAKSRIIQARDSGEQIPIGWALNKNGYSTTDPQEALEGFMLPIAGVKGYGLSLMIDVFGGLLSGASYLDEVTRFYNATSPCMNVGQVFIAMNPVLIYGDSFYEEIDRYIEKIHLSESVDNISQVSLPGERKHENYKKNMFNGIEVSDDFITELNRIFRL